VAPEGVDGGGTEIGESDKVVEAVAREPLLCGAGRHARAASLRIILHRGRLRAAFRQPESTEWREGSEAAERRGEQRRGEESRGEERRGEKRRGRRYFGCTSPRSFRWGCL